jgi:alpha-glucosidase
VGGRRPEAIRVVTTPSPWWRTAVLYQVYPVSFADADGDGVGDLAGLRARLPYLKALGVDGVWVTTWYPSPRRDGGYDITDYCDIDPLFGTLDDARALVDQAHALGLRVLADIVANHTSSEHPWFRAALAAAPGSPERAMYHFRDGRGPGGDEPPNDWLSAFGGAAWTRVTEFGGPGQWYLHLFDPGQPDLNWDNPEVRAAFEKVLRFWLDLGLDGLRIDAAPALAKRAGLPDHGFAPGDRFEPDAWHDSPLWDVDGVHEIYRGWRAVTDAYPDRVMVGEVPVNGPDRLVRYLRPDELHLAFTLDFLKTPWDAAALTDMITATLAAHATVGAPPTWVLSNHDEPRHVTRYGCPRATEAGHIHSVHRDSERPVIDVVLGTRRARAALLLMLALPGSAYLYQGEELGLADVDDLPDDALRDPMFARSGGAMRGRDGCRVPLPWSGDAPPYGFTAGPRAPWLPQPAGWGPLTAAAEDGDPGSMLTLYREALRLRPGLVETAGEAFAWRPSPPGTLAFDRGDGWRCLVNLASGPVPLSPGDGEIVLASEPLPDTALPPDAAVWLSPRR